MAYLGKKYNGPVTSMEIVKKEDLVRIWKQALISFGTNILNTNIHYAWKILAKNISNQYLIIFI